MQDNRNRLLPEEGGPPAAGQCLPAPPGGEGFCSVAWGCPVRGGGGPFSFTFAGVGTRGRDVDDRQGWGWHPRLDCSDGLMGGVSAGPGDTLQIQSCAQEAPPHPHLLVSLTDLMGKQARVREVLPRFHTLSAAGPALEQRSLACQARALPATVAATWPHHLHRGWAGGGR